MTQLSRAQELFAQLLKKRGLADKDARQDFLNPDYDQHLHDPYLLADMDKAVNRLAKAKKEMQKVTIYGDYDIDGMSATSLLFDAFKSFGIDVDYYIPDRFEEGYGINKAALKKLKKQGSSVVVTVDCGSTSLEEIAWADKNDLDVIVTDHHKLADSLPKSVATINPKRTDQDYPFDDLAGVGVAFKLVQAMQKKMDGLDLGHEKWLLDLVALGTVCDVVKLVDENRALVHYGLKVLSQTRRVGIRALAKVAEVNLENVNTYHLGFVLGPRLNASGRMENAKYSVSLLTSEEPKEAVRLAQKLEKFNSQRRQDQDKIMKMASQMAEEYADDPVLVLAHEDWSHGIVGIVAAKLLERYKKPTVLMQILGDTTKGSARSFGDFDIVQGFHASSDLLGRYGGHKVAAGCSLPTENINKFRQSLNDYYKSLGLEDQSDKLLKRPDLSVSDLYGLDEELHELMSLLEPYGNGNHKPIIRAEGVNLASKRLVGKDEKHVKLVISDENQINLDGIAFFMRDDFDGVEGRVSIDFRLDINEFRGRRNIQAMVMQVVNEQEDTPRNNQPTQI